MIRYTAHAVVDGLRGQPVLLAIVATELLAVIVVGFMLVQISRSVERKDALLLDLMQRCVVVGSSAR